MFKSYRSRKNKSSRKKRSDEWHINQWAKKAILLSFRTNDMALINGGPESNNISSPWYDKVPSKFNGWSEEDYKNSEFRAVPGCVVRYGSYIAPNVVLMPSFVNLGAYVDRGTMVDMGNNWFMRTNWKKLSYLWWCWYWWSIQNHFKQIQ